MTETPNRARIWVDGCFDFTHHGHAGALRQARALGNELYVGIHSDEEIAANKGPVVMHLPERVMAVNACRWVTQVVPNAPYVTEPQVMDEWKCWYVAHGDDITRDADGNDCYQVVKDMGRFLEFKRTPNISTTDLIQRMLSSSTSHHLPTLTEADDTDHLLRQPESLERFKMYAQDSSAKHPYAGAFAIVDGVNVDPLVAPSEEVAAKMAEKVYYIDGGWDLFYAGHIEVLKMLRDRADADGAAVVVGLRSDATLNQARGENYPIMNIFERALCVLQCRYVDAVILDAPFISNETYLGALDRGKIHVTRVFKGPAPVVSNRGQRVGEVDPYKYVKQMNMWEQLPAGRYSGMRYDAIVERVLHHRRLYKERQRRKGVV